MLQDSNTSFSYNDTIIHTYFGYKVLSLVSINLRKDVKFLVPESYLIKKVSFFAADPKKDHCNKTVDIYEDVSSPEVTQDNIGKPMTCWYRFRSFRGTPKDWILRIKFNKFKVGNLLNASHCEGGYMQVGLYFYFSLLPLNGLFLFDVE